MFKTTWTKILRADPPLGRRVFDILNSPLSEGIQLLLAVVSGSPEALHMDHSKHQPLCYLSGTSIAGQTESLRTPSHALAPETTVFALFFL